MQVDIDRLQEWIGRSDVSSEVLSSNLVSRFNAMLGQDGSAAEGDSAPLLIHFCLSPPHGRGVSLGEDGHPTRGGFLPPVPLPRRMWAGGALDFHHPLRIGQYVERRSTIKDVQLKSGRSGDLVLVTVEHQIMADGTRAITERQDIVYRDAPEAEAKPAEPVAAPAGEAQRTIPLPPTLLFRYSALTYNGHRIHYDLPYARDVEGYPGLVLHGPLQATYLAQLAANQSGASLKSFSFRSLSPLFDTVPLVLHAAPAENGTMRLWTSRPNGPIAMEAYATW